MPRRNPTGNHENVFAFKCFFYKQLHLNIPCGILPLTEELAPKRPIIKVDEFFFRDKIINGNILLSKGRKPINRGPNHQ